MTDILRSVLEFIASIVNNHGWAIVIFTLLIRFVLMPLDYKSRVSMRKMAKVQPEMERLQKKYQNDKQKLNVKMSELYKKEKVSPLSGCVPMLIQWPILIWMFAAMRAIANEHMVQQVFNMLAGNSPIAAGDAWLWVRNIYAADSFFASIVPDINSLNMIGADVWQKMYETLSPEQVTAIAGNLIGTVDFTAEAANATRAMFIQSVQALPAYQELVAAVPGWANQRILLFSITVYQQYNGYLVLPVLAGVSQVLMTKLTPQTNGTAQPAAGQQNSAGQTAKFMQIFFPFLSVYFCLTSNAGFAIYWVTSNIAMGIMSVVLNKMIDKKTA